MRRVTKLVVACAFAMVLGATRPARAQAADSPKQVGVFIQALEEDVILEVEEETVDARGRPRGLRFQPACAAPCRLNLDASKTYRIAGPGLVPSRTFKLPLDASTVAIQVKEGHVDERVGGVLLTTVGSCLILVGGFWFALSAVAEPDQSNSARLYGGSTLLVGVGALVPGIMLMRLGKTRINIVPGSPAAVAPLSLGSSVRWDF
jgi:hypothetical protein